MDHDQSFGGRHPNVYLEHPALLSTPLFLVGTNKSSGNVQLRQNAWSQEIAVVFLAKIEGDAESPGVLEFPTYEG